MPNRLKDETSPYLRQHADNPVDWHPWGKAAFDLAKQTDRPILLSIGYSACHWCHVMAHESFEDEEVAAQMNRDYVNIKVDREEHPDVDQIYQHALQLFGQHGGWPLTMFLTPKGEPFYGGTYFPPQDNFGRPSFRRVLQGLSHAYQAKKTDVLEQARKVVAGLLRMESRDEHVLYEGKDDGVGDPAVLPADFTQRAAAKLALRMDRRQGGFAGAPKFPNAASLELQLRAFAHSGQAEDAQPVMLTLDRMAAGGIYDQLGGGFARYSTDEQWLVPHFEKMLYDNGQLLRLYGWGHQIASSAGNTAAARRYAQVIHATHGWIEREMRGAAGGLYAAQDADSEGVEGKFFVWTPEQVRALCSTAEADVLMRCYDVRPGGNWNDPHGHGPRGASILHVVDGPRDDEEEDLLRAARDKLFAARRLRVPPGTDDKVLTGWNGLLISGLCEAGRALGAPELPASARWTADFLLTRLRDPQGRLLRVFTQTGPSEAGAARLPATLDDHAFLAEGLYALAAATGELRYLDEARRLMDAVLAAFYDDQTGSFYLAPAADIAHDAPLVARPTSLHDSAIPSGMSVACMNLLRLAELLGPAHCPRYRQIAEQTLLRHGEQALSNPFGWSNLGNAIDLLQHGLTLIVIVHPAAADGLAAAGALRRAADGVRLNDPFVLAVAEDAAGDPQALPAGIADLLLGKGLVDGKAAAYVCRDRSCSAPVTEPAALVRQLTRTA